MTELSARVDALTNAARAVRLQLVDNWHKIVRIDAVSNSQYLTQWAAFRDVHTSYHSTTPGLRADLPGHPRIGVSLFGWRD